MSLRNEELHRDLCKPDGRPPSALEEEAAPPVLVDPWHRESYNSEEKPESLEKARGAPILAAEDAVSPSSVSTSSSIYATYARERAPRDECEGTDVNCGGGGAGGICCLDGDSDLDEDSRKYEERGAPDGRIQPKQPVLKTKRKNH